MTTKQSKPRAKKFTGDRESALADAGVLLRPFYTPVDGWKPDGMMVMPVDVVKGFAAYVCAADPLGYWEAFREEMI